jgi:hypothetical protein
MMTKVIDFSVVVTNKADKTYFGFPRWRDLAEAYGMEGDRGARISLSWQRRYHGVVQVPRP